MQEYPLQIDVHSVKQLLDDGEDFLFLDCRGEDERELARIEGTMFLPMGAIPGELVDLRRKYSDTRIVVHCHLGQRSQQVANYLRAAGIGGAQSMIGGIQAWSELIDPSVPTY